MTSTEMESAPRVDKTVLQVNQAFIVSLLFISFLLSVDLGGQWLVGVTAIAMAIGTIAPPYGPFRLAYWYIFRPVGLLKPKIQVEDPRPHRFALGLGTVFSGLAFLSLLVNLIMVGWALSWIVLVLALINLTVNF